MSLIQELISAEQQEAHRRSRVAWPASGSGFVFVSEW